MWTFIVRLIDLSDGVKQETGTKQASNSIPAEVIQRLKAMLKTTHAPQFTLELIEIVKNVPPKILRDQVCDLFQSIAEVFGRDSCAWFAAGLK